MATKNGLVELRSELRDDIAGMGRDLAQIVLDTQRQITTTQRQITATQRQVAEGRRQAAEGQSQTRMMFEEIVSRLKVLGEGQPGPAA
jgi:TolA-binding protein